MPTNVEYPAVMQSNASNTSCGPLAEEGRDLDESVVAPTARECITFAELAAVIFAGLVFSGILLALTVGLYWLMEWYGTFDSLGIR